MKFKTLIIDGPYLAHRSQDAPYKLTTSDGRDATTIHGFIRSINSVRKQVHPENIIIAWESPGTPSWRRKQNINYKNNRGRLSSQFITQMNDLQNLLYLFGVKQYNSYGNEADDVIAHLSFNTEATKRPVLIYSSDKDLMQLIGNQCQMYINKQFFGVDDVKEKYLVRPEQIPDLLAIAGDKSDNIQGLDGFGFKKAAKLLKECGDIENLNMTTCSRNVVYSIRMKKKLVQNKKLTKLNFDCVLSEIPKEKVNGTIELILDKYELKKMKESIDEYKLMGDKNGIY